jgi:hypothetical protein
MWLTTSAASPSWPYSISSQQYITAIDTIWLDIGIHNDSGISNISPRLSRTVHTSLPLFLSLSDTGNFRVVVLQQLRADSIIVKSFGAIPPFLEETQSCVAPFSYAVVRQVRILKCWGEFSLCASCSRCRFYAGIDCGIQFIHINTHKSWRGVA